MFFFSLKPIVGDSATINNNTQNTPSGRDWKPTTEKEHKTGKIQNPGNQKSENPGRQRSQNLGSQKSQISDSDNEVEIVTESFPLQTVSITISFKLPVNIERGLPQAIKTRLSFETSFNLSHYHEAIVEALLAEVVAFRGDPLISIDDLKALSGKEASNPEDMWLPNFVIDAYLSLVSSTCKAATAIKWEIFEKSSYSIRDLVVSC